MPFSDFIAVWGLVVLQELYGSLYSKNLLEFPVQSLFFLQTEKS